MKFKLVKRIFGQRAGVTLGEYANIEDARAALVAAMSYIDDGNDEGFCPDEESRSAELEFADNERKIEEIKEWSVPCVFDRPTGRELATIVSDSFSFDNYSVGIEIFYDLGDIPEQLAEFRKEAGLTQKELSDLCGVAQPNIARIEQGRYNVSVEILVKILAAMGRTLVIR